MTPIGMRARRGVTLVELLVVMGIITLLAALALMIAPGIANQDNTLKGTADVQATLRISQSMAAAAKIPRGVRFLIPSTGSLIVTELQYLEAPPVIVPTPSVMVDDPYASPYTPPVTAGNAQNAWRPQVQFNYMLNNKGVVHNRICHIVGLTEDQALQVVTGSTLVLPALNYFAQILTATIAPAINTTPLTVTVTLAVYPDPLLGSAGIMHNTQHYPCYETFYFGIYGPPRPLLGEPTIELPLNIGVDLAISQPIGTPYSTTNTNPTYDIMFAPSGQRIATPTVAGSGNQVFLWVRDYTKVANMTPGSPSSYSTAAPNSWVFTQNQFLQGGEQQIVGIRAAAIGSAPVLWPTFSGGSGTYTAPNDPFSFARDKLTGQ